MIELSSKELDTVQHILESYVPDYRVWAYGSRVKDDFYPYSDLDLVIISDISLDWQWLEKIRDAFAESDLSFKVDITDWQSLPENMRHEIHRHHDVISRGKVQ